uniref:3-cyclic-nucleotide phosphodiesterase n=1 Tax=Tetraselmis sp. GSL018 TaxID=582737 RepID=A0A061RIF7_9CHLO
MQKVLDFLQKEQKFFGRPTPREALELHRYLVANVANLQAPDLASQLKENRAYSKPVASYLMDFVMPVQRDNDVSETSLHRSLSRSSSQVTPVLSISLSRGSRGFIPTECEIPVPAELEGRIGVDLFLDAVSPNSALARSPSPLSAVFKQSLSVLGLKSRLPRGAVDPLLGFALAIEEGYPDTHYHCKLHAADVTHRLVAILQHSGIASALVEEDWVTGLGMLIAGAVHNYRHPQVTNGFLVHQEDEVALTYNDTAVSENFGLCESRKILRDLGIRGAVFPNDPNKHRWRRFINTLTSAVLATDMAQHFDILGKFMALVLEDFKLQSIRPRDRWKAMSSEQRTVTLQIAIKVANIGHNSLPIHLSKLWLKRLQDEYFEQGDREARAGMRVSALMDRRKPGVFSRHPQVGFFEVIAIPLFNAWSKGFPQCECLNDKVLQNYEFWKSFPQ